jgi:hypothetical protein
MHLHVKFKNLHKTNKMWLTLKFVLVREARAKLETLKAKFVTESAKKMSNAVSQHLKAELGQLQEDIKVARENNFGRRIFEAYAAEFGATHFNEKAEVRKLHDMIAHKDAKLAEAIQITQKAKVLVESKEREMRILKESNQREAALEELLSPLNKEKAEVMRNLLESVQTTRLSNAFEKYLPAVLAEGSVKAKKVITESVSVATGDKSARVIEEENKAKANVIDSSGWQGCNLRLNKGDLNVTRIIRRSLGRYQRSVARRPTRLKA